MTMRAWFDKGTWRIYLAGFAFAALPLTAAAQTTPPTPEEILSLDGKLAAEGNPVEGALVKNFKAPVLRLYRSPAVAPKGLVLLFPGGGYAVLEMKNEGGKTVELLNGEGYDVALLEYHLMSSPETASLPPAEKRKKAQDLALAEAQQAWHLLKEKAAELKLHTARTAIMGYSAGGHLAARLAQSLPDPEQPTDLILIYPAYLERTLPGQTVHEVVPPQKPGRLFALIGDKDKAEWIQGCKDYVEAWKKTPGEATFVLLPEAPHGFGASKLDSLKPFLSEAGY